MLSTQAPMAMKCAAKNCTAMPRFERRKGRIETTSGKSRADESPTASAIATAGAPAP